MDAVRQHTDDVELQYIRLPITSRSVIEFDDIQSLIQICLRGDLEKDTAVILNDQLGRGRSTVISVIMNLIIRWIKRTRETGPSMPTRTPRLRPRPNSRSSWQIVNSCLRCLRHSGLEVKREVDDVIDQCGEAYNLREVIEDLYKQADAADMQDCFEDILGDAPIPSLSGRSRSRCCYGKGKLPAVDGRSGEKK
jgi:hypothetical protein